VPAPTPMTRHCCVSVIMRPAGYFVSPHLAIRAIWVWDPFLEDAKWGSVMTGPLSKPDSFPGFLRNYFKTTIPPVVEILTHTHHRAHITACNSTKSAYCGAVTAVTMFRTCINERMLAKCWSILELLGKFFPILFINCRKQSYTRLSSSITINSGAAMSHMPCAQRRRWWCFLRGGCWNKGKFIKSVCCSVIFFDTYLKSGHRSES